MNNQQLNQAFIMASIQERQYIQTFTTQNPDFDVWKVTSVSGFSPFDCFVQSGTPENKWAVEVKIRTFNMNKYPTAYIKCAKWYRMVNECNTHAYRQHGVQPMFMMFFRDGNVALWNLYECSTKYVEKEYKLHNCIEDSPIVKNKLFELDFNEATIYRWK